MLLICYMDEFYYPFLQWLCYLLQFVVENTLDNEHKLLFDFDQIRYGTTSAVNSKFEVLNFHLMYDNVSIGIFFWYPYIPRYVALICRLASWAHTTSSVNNRQHANRRADWSLRYYSKSSASASEIPGHLQDVYFYYILLLLLYDF